jgi:hypothetical protein
MAMKCDESCDILSNGKPWRAMESRGFVGLFSAAGLCDCDPPLWIPLAGLPTEITEFCHGTGQNVVDFNGKSGKNLHFLFYEH